MLNVLLLKLCRSVLNEKAFDTALSVSNDMISQAVDMPKDLEDAILDFLSDKDEFAFTRLSKVVLTGNFLEDQVEDINLIVFLAKEKWLPLNEIAMLLSSISYLERDILAPNYIKALEAADLVVEDLNDGFMKVEDDDLLLNAIGNI